MEDKVIHENKTFTNVDYSEKSLRNREFVKCIFENCNFNNSDLRGNDFEDCIFKQCNLSMALVEGTGFRNALLDGCKLLGVDFTKCNKFSFSFLFKDSLLDFSNFYGTKLKKTKFEKCSLKEVEFSQADLTAAVFLDCDLMNTIFSDTILEKADFRTAKHFSINPQYNKMKQARFSAFNIIGLLDQHQLDIDYGGL